MTRRVAFLLPVLAVLTLIAAPARAVDPEYQNFMRIVSRYMAQAQYEAASGLLEQVLAKHPLDVTASITYVEALLHQHRLDEAETFLTGALERISDKADLYRMRAKLRRAQQRPEDAFADVLRAVEANPERGPWAYRETVELLGAGLDPARARKAVEAARGSSDAPHFVLLTAVVAVHEGKRDEALKLVTQYDAQTKAQGEALRRFADEMALLQKRDLSRKALAIAVERAPSPERRTDHLFRSAELADQDAKYQEALSDLARIALEREGKAAAANARLRSAEIRDTRLHDPAGAIVLYEAILNDPALGHRRPTLLVQMADCYVRLSRFDEAARAYAEAGPEAFDPEDAELSALRLADLEFFRGAPDSALKLYQQMAEANPRSRFTDQAAGRYILVNKYLSLRMAKALVVTWGRMEWGRMAQDSTVVAKAATELLDRDAQGELAAEALLALSEVAEAGGNLEAARARLEELTRSYAWDKRRAPEALLRLGVLLADKMKRPEEALPRFETLLTDYPVSVQAVEARRRVETLRRDLRS
jgi:tetratricopeptide (TPR) repeat protein